jgi:signal transduction histidine kinase
MKNFLRQSGAWATSSPYNIFTRARLRLTFYYTLIIALIVVIFSVVLFFVLTNQLRTSVEGEFPDEKHQHDFVAATTRDLQKNIIFIDLGTIAVVAGFAYFLAGKTLKPIKFALDAQKEFSANASHELRTPLAIIKNASEVVLQNPSATVERYKQLTASNMEETERMSDIVENLLSLSRSDHGSPLSSLERIDLTELIGRVVEKFQILAQEKKIGISWHPSSSLAVNGNRASLERVFFNILKNAVAYTPANGNIIIRLAAKAKHVEVSVTDTGLGIASEDLPHVFERFYKGTKGQTASQGAGLGLSIVREIVRAHNGTINIQSTLNKGTAVIIILPS